MRRFLISVLVFIIAVVVFFPYSTVFRYVLVKNVPGLEIAELQVSPWSGAAIRGLTYPFSPDVSLYLETVKLEPISYFKSKYALFIEADESGAELQITQTGNNLNLIFKSQSLPLNELLPGFGANITVSGNGKGTIDLEKGTITPESSGFLLFAGKLTGTAKMKMLGIDTIKVCKANAYVAPGQIKLTNIVFQTSELTFKGEGLVRPYPPFAKSILNVNGKLKVDEEENPISQQIRLSDLF